MRKNPAQLASWLGPMFIMKLMAGRLSIKDIEQKLSEKFSLSGRALLTDISSLGTDLDRAEDWAKAERYMQPGA